MNLPPMYAPFHPEFLLPAGMYALARGRGQQMDRQIIVRGPLADENMNVSL